MGTIPDLALLLLPVATSRESRAALACCVAVTHFCTSNTRSHDPRADNTGSRAHGEVKDAGELGAELSRTTARQKPAGPGPLSRSRIDRRAVLWGVALSVPGVTGRGARHSAWQHPPWHDTAEMRLLLSPRRYGGRTLNWQAGEYSLNVYFKYHQQVFGLSTSLTVIDSAP
ncbi:hypothetical protein AAFF_G00082830 [Aldrovandia affinis]|uniref:Secreted protein n=1 Tax=Aldrovandia affinis TaxID=143900 RepID=A0AAD7RX13_9TELE|nr:hypothetical protein AAFF_G00082830 [Aldrovandia affinis]